MLPPEAYSSIFVVTPLTSGKTVTAWKDERAETMTAFFECHLLVIYEGAFFVIYLDAASFVSVRHFGESLCPAGPQSGLVKIIIFVSDYLIASQRQWY